MLAPIETLAERVLQSVRPPTIVLDADLRVCLANRAFCEAFQFAPDEIEGRWFPELGVGNRNVRGVRALLERARLRDGQIGTVEVEHDISTFGSRRLVIHARTLAGPGADEPLILLEIDDATEHADTERYWQELIATAAHEAASRSTSRRASVEGHPIE